MKRKLFAIILLAMLALQLTACSLETTCKASDCDETDIYEDGYCKLHYYENVGENVIKELLK